MSHFKNLAQMEMFQFWKIEKIFQLKIVSLVHVQLTADHSKNKQLKKLFI